MAAVCVEKSFWVVRSFDDFWSNYVWIYDVKCMIKFKLIFVFYFIVWKLLSYVKSVEFGTTIPSDHKSELHKKIVNYSMKKRIDMKFFWFFLPNLITVVRQNFAILNEAFFLSLNNRIRNPISI